MLDFNEVTGFEWDDGNKDKNFTKRNVTQKESEEVFKNNPKIFESKVKLQEPRHLTLGETNEQKKLAVVFTIRKNNIRIISSWSQSKKEKTVYNEHETNKNK